MQRVEYQFAEGFVFKVDAQAIGEELAALGPVVTPEDVVAWAKANPESALHEVIFEKSTREAEFEFRMVLARRLLRAVVKIEKSERKPPQRVRVNLEQGSSRYVDTETLTGQQRLDYEVGQAMLVLEHFQKRYRHLRRFRELVAQIDQLLS